MAGSSAYIVEAQKYDDTQQKLSEKKVKKPSGSIHSKM